MVCENQNSAFSEVTIRFPYLFKPRECSPVSTMSRTARHVYVTYKTIHIMHLMNHNSIITRVNEINMVEHFEIHGN